MKTKNNGKHPAARLEIGSVVLSAAAGIDTVLITARLTAFATVHQSYSVAQRKVDAFEAKLRNAQVHLAQLDIEQDEAVEDLARLLIADGQPRVAPFSAFGVDSPSIIRKLPYGEEAKALHKLVAAVQLDKSVGRSTLAAARTAESAAQAVESALLALDTCLATLRDAREGRDAIAPMWEEALAALKRGARAAKDDGAPGLYAALFGNSVRSKKAKTVAAMPAPTPPAAAAA